MATVLLELDRDREMRLQTAAKRAHKSEAEVCRDALESYLSAEPQESALSDDAYDPMLELIGIANDGPRDDRSCIITGRAIRCESVRGFGSGREAEDVWREAGALMVN